MSEAAPNLPTLNPGELVAGKYRVERLIGEGGMGYVVLATHERLGQRVALKVLIKLGAQESRRFEVEARASARLRSVHVARTIDVGVLDDGRPYLVMEYLEGKDLGAVVELLAETESGLPIETAVDYVLQACEAVAEAHAVGIVHRDLKPSNLFLTTTSSGKPCVKVLDFGISKIVGMSEELKITGTHEILGSPVYMSPEQLTSTRDVDGRADVWSLGVILYELLTKRPPFEGKTLAGLAMAIGRDAEKPVHHHRPEIPDDLSIAVGRCLIKDADRRVQSIAELVELLTPFRANVIPASPSTPRARVIVTQSTMSASPDDAPLEAMSATAHQHAPPRAPTAAGPATPTKTSLVPIIVGALVIFVIATSVLAFWIGRSRREAAATPPIVPAASMTAASPVESAASTIVIPVAAAPVIPSAAASVAATTSTPRRLNASGTSRPRPSTSASPTAPASRDAPSLYGRE